MFSGGRERVVLGINSLKVQPCKLYKNKYLIASTQIKNSEIFAFIAVLAFKLLSREVLFINRKKRRLPFKKIANLTGKFLKNYN